MQRKAISDDKGAAIRRCLKAHPDWDAERLRNALRRWHATTAEIRAASAGGTVPAVPATKAAGKAKTERPAGRVVTLAAIRERFDVLAGIKRELARLGDGELIEEADIRERVSGRDATRFRRAVENNAQAVEPLRTKLRLTEGEARWYWGKPSAVAEAAKWRDA